MKTFACAVVLICIFLYPTLVKAQTPARYLVQLKYKGDNPFTISNPSAYLSQRSLARRVRYAIPLDSTDLPVTPRYIDSLKSIPTVVVLNASKWLNQVSIQITDLSAANLTAVFNRINAFHFVRGTSAIASRVLQTNGKNDVETTHPLLSRGSGIEGDMLNYGASSNQVKMHNGQFLHNIGLKGQTMIIGVLDGGFLNYQTVKAFDSARANGQILGTWDFVDREPSVNEDHVHGMECLSVMAANIPGQFVGTAPYSKYYLFRSEDVNSEYPIEEHNWVCAAERVDSVGGDLISSSLGYNVFDAPLTSQSHTFSDLDGNKTMAARGADLAAKKGILVVNAAGNEGSNTWGRIITPADGDSVLAVGAVNATGVPASFTSRGPSADGQVKPDVASQGVSTTIQLPNNTVGAGNGTSFACPNMAGLASCLWQGFPEVTNYRIIVALREAGSQASTPDDRVGYGIPDVKKAFITLLKEYASASASITNCQTTVSWLTKDVAGMRYELERLVPGQISFQKIADLNSTAPDFGNRSVQYTDNLVNVPTGHVSYRIRQVVDTAASSFAAVILDTVTVSNNASCVNGSTSLSITPNPSRNKITVKLITPDAIPQLTIRIFNTLGQLVAINSQQKSAGVAYYDFNLTSLAAGVYIVRAYNGDDLILSSQILKL